MQENIFDLYQRKQLIESIGSDDKNYQSLMEAATTITKTLKAKPSKIINYALVAIDNQIPEDEPILAEVETSIQAHWKMVRSHFAQMPKALYRCIILQSLQNLVRVNKSFANVIYLSLVDVYPHVEIQEGEKAVLKVFLESCGDIAEGIAVNEWTVDKKEIEVDLPELKLKLFQVGVTIDENVLKEGLISASGPKAEGENANRPNANPNWPHIQNTSWAFKFAPLATSAISTTVNKALKDLGTNIDKNSGIIQTAINDFASELAKSLNDALNSTIQSSIAVERRSQLLWWKETLYSRKLHKSYRKLSKFEGAIAMAVDLYEMLPAIYPVSVDYILREALNKVYGLKENELTFGEFIEQVNDTKNQEFLKIYFPKGNELVNRMDMISFMEKVIYHKMDVEGELLKCVGVTSDKKMSYEDIAVWVLHCLSVKRLTHKVNGK